MKKLSIFFILIFSISDSQQEKVNPKGKYFFGIDLGLAKSVGSGNNMETHQNFAPGINAEYYFTKNLSVLAEIKYYKTNLAYSFSSSSSSGGWWTFDLSGSGDPYRALFFDGEMFSIPLFVKYQFAIYRNFRMNFGLGPNFSFETKSNYIIPENPNADTSMFKKSYVNFTFREGLLYFLDEKSAIQISMEYNPGSPKGAYNGLLGRSVYRNETIIWGLGYQKRF